MGDIPVLGIHEGPFEVRDLERSKVVLLHRSKARRFQSSGGWTAEGDPATLASP
jgi:hypothetical protein